jgi:2-polyprenyl-3-methyl-5-hydroxy-6-metoxy-1,4-benzoquinol methylase
MNSQYGVLTDQYAAKNEGYYDNARPEMLSFVPMNISSLLEVGCSSASFGGLVKKEMPACEVWGIDPSAEAISRATEKIDRAICGTFEAGIPELEGRRFECVVFNDVLEHLVNPESALSDCKRYLAADGAIVASIPNILHFYQISKILIEQDWRYENEGILDNTHLRFFTKKSIIRMFEESGFRVEEITGINASFGMKYKIANALTLGRLRDWRYVQFAIRARIAS